MLCWFSYSKKRKNIQQKGAYHLQHKSHSTSVCSKVNNVPTWFFHIRTEEDNFYDPYFSLFCRNTFPITSPRTTSWLDSHPKNPIHLEKNLPVMLSKIHHKFTSFFLKRKMKTHKTKQKNNNRINAHIDFFSVQLRNHCLYFFSSYIYYQQLLKINHLINNSYENRISKDF